MAAELRPRGRPYGGRGAVFRDPSLVGRAARLTVTAGLCSVSLHLAAAPAPAAAQGIPAPGEAVTEPFQPPGIANPPAALPVEPTPFSPTSSESVVMNLIRLLVEQGVITPEVADALLAQARAEAEAARPVGARLSEPGGRVSVPYIPAPVREQITEDVKQDVLIQARAENWAAPNAVPEWVSRFRLFGDLRSRFEHVGFGSDNFGGSFQPGVSPPEDLNRGFVDFNEINTGDPFVFNNGAPQPDDELLPLLNTTEGRNRFRLRARLGVEATIAEEVQGVIRVATGSDNGPVSTNQTLGAASETGQGTNFSKYQIWLDQAYLRIKPIEQLKIDIGRAPNPFFRTNLIWDDDVQFDGASISGEFEINEQVRPFFTVGGFPVYNSAFDFASGNIGAQESRNRYMIGSQIGTKYKPVNDIELTFGVANYFFNNMQGEVGDCTIDIDGDITAQQCPTDNTRQQFAQKGNTLVALRNNILVGTPPGPLDPIPDPQYFGLASDFNILALNFRFDYAGFDPIHVIFDAEYTNNLAFNKSNMPDFVFPFSGGVDGIREIPVGDADIGRHGFLVQLTVGHPEIDQRWDWKVGLGYRYLQSDAAVDSFVDSDFHLGGTNAKGFILQGQLGVADNTWLSARWLTSQEIAGETLKIDVIQVDLNARF